MVRLHSIGDPLAPHSLSASELKQLLSAERAGEPFLAYRDGVGRFGLFTLTRERQITTIGRRIGMHLPISWDGEVSGLHAELRCVGEELMVVDDGLSTNGTYVNGRRVGGRQRLRHGDRIRVGQTTLAYHAAATSSAEETVTAGQIALPRLTDAQQRVLTALCRPCLDGDSPIPATNAQIAAEVFSSIDAVKMHLRSLFGKFELSDLPQNEKRARLVECAMQFGAVSARDLG